MIEINLLPGAKKAKRSGGASFDFRAMLGDVTQRIRDPWLISAVVGVLIGGGAVGFMYWRTSARETELTETVQRAVQDSIRNAAVLREQGIAEAQKDSVFRQIAIIKAIDASRYIWPHVMDEVYQALPQYTWIRSLQQTSAVPSVPPEVEAGVRGSSAGKSRAALQAEAEEAAAASVITVRLVGQSVDLQAITRFVRQLEDSPWLENVTFNGTQDVIAQPSNKEVKEFTIEMRVSRPDSTHIRRVPLTVGVR
jgi:Tfp pilus assembly protein PilN